jgi:hypothetical protein
VNLLYGPNSGYDVAKFVWRCSLSLSKIFLIVALICFILEALGNRVGFKTPFGLLGAGLAFLTAAQLF